MTKYAVPTDELSPDVKADLLLAAASATMSLIALILLVIG